MSNLKKPIIPSKKISDHGEKDKMFRKNPKQRRYQIREVRPNAGNNRKKIDSILDQLSVVEQKCKQVYDGMQVFMKNTYVFTKNVQFIFNILEKNKLIESVTAKNGNTLYHAYGEKPNVEKEGEQTTTNK